MKRHTKQCREPRIAIAFCLAILSCMLGLSLCLIKSPQAKSADYLAISKEAMNTNPVLAAAAAWEAARLNPTSYEVWGVLAETLQQKGDYSAAQKAKTIAMRLHKNPDDHSPVYAMPAELRLSFLADSSGDL